MQLIRSFLIYVLMSSQLLLAQSSYLDRPDLLAMADSCLRHTYNFSFDQARFYQQKLESISPHHPAPCFLDALIIYWENFPMTPENKNTQIFINLLNQSVDRSEWMLQNEKNRLEGIFFDLFSRAFKAMFWADNGKSVKVIPDLGTMYSHTKEGFELMDQFSEFYFSTGLYNYYIEAYPEAHPAYKPLVSFMHDGDRKLGLEQLNHAINHTSYVKVESLLFMTLIQLNYENDLENASLFAERLNNSYPRNSYFRGLRIIILLYLHQFDQAGELLDRPIKKRDNYSDMITTMAVAFISEKKGEFAEAEKKYSSTIDLADIIGPFGDTYKAIAYMGLSRISEGKGLYDEAKRYARKAADYTSYSFILGD
jgi:tetratricopeptide (TPR) repeat protein